MRISNNIDVVQTFLLLSVCVQSVEFVANITHTHAYNSLLELAMCAIVWKKFDAMGDSQTQLCVLVKRV